MKRFFKGKKGFTLIELLIVIAVLAALAAVVVPAVSTFLSNSKVAAANNEVAAVKTAATAYLAENNVFPASSAALGSFLSQAPIATYTIDTATGQLTGITAKGTWPTNIYFHSAIQGWNKTAPDN